MEYTDDLINKPLWDQLEEQINAGMLGMNVGLPMGFDKLSKFVSNIQPGRYDLIGGATGTGKTALVDSAYVYNPIKYLQQTPDCHYNFKVIYYSIEITPLQKIAKMICRKLWEDHKIILDVESLFSKGSRARLGRDLAEKVFQYRDYFEKMLDEYLIFYSAASPDFVWKGIKDYVEQNGRIVKNSNGIIEKYVSNRPNEIVILVIDHISLIERNSKDATKKEAIDRLSKMLVVARNLFNFSPVVVSQFNRGIEGMDRKKLDSLEPQLSDFKDTGATQEDCNTAIALFNPFKYGVEKHNNYDIKKLHRSYRSLSILKNRDGQDNLSLGLFFMGATGFFKELPSASELTNNPELYNKILKLANGN